MGWQLDRVKKERKKAQTPYILLRLETLNMIVLPVRSQRGVSYGKDQEREKGFSLFI